MESRNSLHVPYGYYISANNTNQMKNKRALLKIYLTTLCLLVMCGLTQAQTVDDMRRAVRENRLSDAFNYAMVLANQGNPEAQYLAGLFQITGNSTPKNQSVGLAYMSASANNGFGLAQEYIGLVYAEGKEAPRNQEKAFTYLSVSATKGFPRSMLALGYMYLRGEGVAKDVNLAQSWFDKVSQIGGADGAKWREAAAKANEEIVKAKTSTIVDTRPTTAIANTNLTRTESQRPSQIDSPVSVALASEVPQSIQKLRTAFQRPLISINDPRLACQETIETNPKLKQLREKISLSGLTDVPFEMLSNQAIPIPQELQLIALWAEGLKKCRSESEDFRSYNYPKQQIEILEAEDDQLFAQAIQLYSKKISYSRFNINVAQIFKNSKIALANLSESQKLTAQREAAMAAAAREEQRNNELRRQEESRRLEAIRQSERSQIAALRKQWETKCEFNRRNEYEHYYETKHKDCEKISTPAAQVVCTIGVVTGARNYAKSAYDACMSDAPTY